MQTDTDLIAVGNALLPFSLENSETKQKKERNGILYMIIRLHLRSIRESLNLYNDLRIDDRRKFKVPKFNHAFVNYSAEPFWITLSRPPLLICAYQADELQVQRED